MRKVIVYIAMSLDGYIADEKGGIDWLGGQDDAYLGDYGYAEFIKDIDTVVMGYTTYHQVETELSPNFWPYEGMKTYVVSHRQLEDTEHIEFVNGSLETFIQDLKRTEGKDIWICGGASIVNQLIDLDLIDTYHLTIMPTLLGSGIRLFEKSDKIKKLKLMKASHINGVIECIYHK